MKVREYKELDGMFNIRTLGELRTYADSLVNEYGEDTEYECYGYDQQECVVILRDETEAEEKERLRLHDIKESLKLNTDGTYHRAIVNEIGFSKYNEIMNNINGVKYA